MHRGIGKGTGKLALLLLAMAGACGGPERDLAAQAQGSAGAQATGAAAQSPGGVAAQDRRAATAAVQTASDAEEERYSPLAFPPRSHPYGASLETWTERLWRWDYSIPAAQSPFLDLTGADCAVRQPEGPVWFIGPPLDPGGVVSYALACTVPHEKAVLFDLGSTFNDYPCPDPSFHPAPGQTLYEFLLAGAQGGPNSINSLGMTVDGAALQHLFDYRVTSDDLFSFTGDPSLATSVDGCVTGRPQPGVSDGFFVMLKPLPPGRHTVVLSVADSHGTVLTETYTLTMR